MGGGGGGPADRYKSVAAVVKNDHIPMRVLRLFDSVNPNSCN